MRSWEIRRPWLWLLVLPVVCAAGALVGELIYPGHVTNPALIVGGAGLGAFAAVNRMKIIRDRAARGAL